MKHPFTQWITPAVFLLLIFGFTTANLLTPDRDFSENENRPLAQKPQFSMAALFDGDYTAAVETYLTDQFVGRDSFIGIKTETDYISGKRDANDIYFAKDGYLIQKNPPESIDRGRLTRNIDSVASYTNRAVARYGKEHVRVMIVPTAGEILSEKLPPFAQEFHQPDLLSAIQKKIPEGTFVDLQATLRKHKDEYIFYKTDHHWTTDGAFYGYEAYCESLGISPKSKSNFKIETVSEQFEGTLYSKARLLSTKPDQMKAYFPKQELICRLDYNWGERQSDSLYEESWLEKKDKYSYFLGGNNPVIKITTNHKNGRHLLLLKDSYAHCMTPFLGNEYETIELIDLRYFNEKLSDYETKNNYTDVLVLYNAVTFSGDTGVTKIDR